jgi:hypothetical protein
VIGFFFVYKNIFLFLSSKYAVEACDGNIADIVHFSNHVQASHVMHLFIFVLLTQSYFSAMCVLLISDLVSNFLSQSPTFTAGKISSAGEQGGGGVFFPPP